MSLRTVVRKFAFLSPALYDYQQFCRSLLSDAFHPSVHEPDFLYFHRYAGRQPLFLDIGANTGQSIRSIKNVVPDCRVVSFEPNPDCLPALKRTAALYKDAQVIGCGLGEQPGRVELHIPRAKGFVFSQHASLITPDANYLATELSKRGFSFVSTENLDVDVRSVEVCTLDSFALHPDIVKIDVEGAELRVLRGGIFTISCCKPVFLIEAGGAQSEMLSFMKEIGYRPFSYSPETDQLQPLSGAGLNVLYLPDRAGSAIVPESLASV